jgi:hypothetical protein
MAHVLEDSQRVHGFLQNIRVMLVIALHFSSIALISKNSQFKAKIREQLPAEKMGAFALETMNSKCVSLLINQTIVSLGQIAAYLI